MPDISLCFGGPCPVKEACRRHKAVSDSEQQQYFNEVPGTWEYLGSYPFPWMPLGEGKRWKCDFFEEER